MERGAAEAAVGVGGGSETIGKRNGKIEMSGQYDPNLHHRRSIRLTGYDYSQCGAYFVTICVQKRELLFGNLVDGQMQVNEVGVMVKHMWEWLPQQYPYVSIDEFVVMPNHFHGILIIENRGGGSIQGGSRTAPTEKRKPVGRLIGVFKTVTTKRFNETRCSPGEGRGGSRTALWQRNYYEHSIRNEDDFRCIAEYIQTNPLHWRRDELWTSP